MTARGHIFAEDGKITLVLEGDSLDRENTLRIILEILRHEWRTEGIDFFKGVETALKEMRDAERDLN